MKGKYKVIMCIQENDKDITRIEFSASRKAGAWKQVFEHSLKQFTPNQVITYLCKRYDLGYGYSTLLGTLTLGKWDDSLKNEK